jgi:hypothetical protein
MSLNELRASVKLSACRSGVGVDVFMGTVCQVRQVPDVPEGPVRTTGPPGGRFSSENERDRVLTVAAGRRFLKAER